MCRKQRSCSRATVTIVVRRNFQVENEFIYCIATINQDREKWENTRQFS